MLGTPSLLAIFGIPGAIILSSVVLRWYVGVCRVTLLGKALEWRMAPWEGTPGYSRKNTILGAGGKPLVSTTFRGDTVMDHTA